MQYHYELDPAALWVLISFVIVAFAIVIGCSIFEYFRDNKKMKVKVPKGKKITIEACNKIQEVNLERISELENRLSDLETERHNIMCLIYLVKSKEIDVNKLEALGLQRYNATYGKRFTFITDFEYEQLKKYHFIDLYYYEDWRKQYENNKQNNQKMRERR